MSIWKNQRLHNIFVKNVCAPNLVYRKHSEGTTSIGTPEELTSKPFNEIPGPKPLPLIANTWRYFPVIEEGVNSGFKTCHEAHIYFTIQKYAGDYTFDDMYTTGLKKYQQYGPLVREEVVPNVTVLWVFKPEDIEKVFKNEGKYPTRRSHLALEKYRKDRPNVYRTGGLLPTNGPEWARLRSEFQKGLSRPQKVKEYLPASNNVMQEFVTMLESEEDKVIDLMPELSRLFLELLILVTFSVRMGSLSNAERHPNSKTSKLIDSALVTNSNILDLDTSSQLWRYFETGKYKKLRKAQEYMEMVALELISERMYSKGSSPKDESEVECLLDFFLTCKEVDFRDTAGMILDLLLAGIDTTTYTSCFALYHLAVNKEAQEGLFEESKSLLEEPTSPVTAAVLARAQYTKAVLKETYRLNPISIGVGRLLAQDAVLSGYLVPKGTNVVTQNQVSSRLPEYFPEPEKFIPERWLKEHSYYKTPHPYLVLPFGHGSRSCIARWLAEQHLQTLLLRMVRAYKITWAGSGPLGIKTSLINLPDRPVLVRLRKR